MTALFAVLAVGLAAVAFAAARAHAWIVAIGAGSLAGFMATLVHGSFARRK